MNTVVGLHGVVPPPARAPDEQLIEMLERYVALAKAGEIVAAAIACRTIRGIDHDRRTFSTDDAHAVVTALHLALHEITVALIESPD